MNNNNNDNNDNDMNIINVLNDDVLDEIYKKINISCHTCKLKFTFKKKFYKKICNNYFCSKECYNHI